MREERETYIAMATEMLKQLDLAQGALGQDLLTEDVGDLLHGNTLASLDIGGSAGKRLVCSTAPQEPSNPPDNTVCTLAQLLGDIVLFVDDEILVEDLEDLAAL